MGVDEPVVVVGHSFGGGVAIRLAHDYPDAVRSLVLVNSIGGSAWKRGKRLRPWPSGRCGTGACTSPTDMWPLRQATRVLPVMLEDAVPNLMRNPRSLWRVAQLARNADLRPELEELKRRGLPVTIIWAKRDGVVPRESFDALCVAAGAEGRVVDGSHSWLLADPDRFSEVITNDVEVAQLARSLGGADDGELPTLAPELRRPPAVLTRFPAGSRPRRTRDRVGGHGGGRRGPAMRRSPRRRVTPRRSSSARSGRACLRVAPTVVAERRHREPGRPSRGQQAGRRPRRGVERRRREVEPVALHHGAPSHQLPQLAPVDTVGRRGRAAARLEGGEERVLGQRVGGAGQASPPGGDHDAVEPRRAPGAIALVRGRRRRGPGRPAAATRATTSATSAATAPGAATHRPRSGGRRSPVSASSSPASIQPRSATTRSTERSGRALDAGSTGATSSTSPPPTVSSRPLSRST